MILTLDDVKTYLRIDGTDEDSLLQMLTTGAENYLANCTGVAFDSTYELARVFCLVLVADWYENRTLMGKASDRVRPILDSIVMQLKYCYPAVIAP